MARGKWLYFSFSADEGKGDSRNGTEKGTLGPLTHPAYFEEAGTDPSPRFQLYDSTGIQYKQSTSMSRPAADLADREVMTSIEFGDPSEYATVLAFQVPEGASGFWLQISIRKGLAGCRRVGIRGLD